LALYWSFSSGVGLKLAQSSSPIGEMSQTPLTNKKQGSLDLVQYTLLTNVNSVYSENIFCVIKALDHLKNLKTGRVPYLGLEVTMHVMSSKAKSIS
jgi:hypothetical protein